MPMYEADGNTIIQMGHGDIRVSRGQRQELNYEDEIIFSCLDKPHRIGEETDAPDESGKSVHIIFEKVESLDVVIDALVALREAMVQNLGELEP